MDNNFRNESLSNSAIQDGREEACQFISQFRLIQLLFVKWGEWYEKEN